MMNRTVIISATVVCGVLNLRQHIQPQGATARKRAFRNVMHASSAKIFDRGMLYQHSFWYSASKRTFEDALKADPQCIAIIGASR